MSKKSGWESAFLAVSAVLGEPIDDAVSALGEEARGRAGTVLQGLRSPSRDVRARAIAQGVSDVAIAVDAMRLT